MRALVTAFVSLLLTAASPVRAEPIVLMEFKGTVVQGGPTMGVNLVPGDQLHARVAFDQNTQDYDPSPQYGRYQFLVMDVFTNRGTVFFKQPSYPWSAEGIRIYRSASYDEFRFNGFRGLHDDTEVYARFPAGTFPDDQLPLTLPFAQATQSEFAFSLFAPITRETLTGFTSAVVPEPQVAAMAATLLITSMRLRCQARSRRAVSRQH